MRYYSEKGLFGNKLVATANSGKKASIKSDAFGKFYDVKPNEQGVVVTDKRTGTESEVYGHIDFGKGLKSFIASNKNGHVIYDIERGRSLSTKELITTDYIITTNGDIFIYSNADGSVAQFPLENKAYLDENGHAVYLSGNIFTWDKAGNLCLMNDYRKNLVSTGLSKDPNVKITKMSDSKMGSDFCLIEDKEKKVVLNPKAGGVVFETSAENEVFVAGFADNNYHIGCYSQLSDTTDLKIKKYNELKNLKVEGKLVSVHDDGMGNGKVVTVDKEGVEHVIEVALPQNEEYAQAAQETSTGTSVYEEEISEKRAAHEERAKQIAEELKSLEVVENPMYGEGKD